MVQPRVTETSAVSAHRQADLVRASLIYAPSAGTDRSGAHVSDPLRAAKRADKPA